MHTRGSSAGERGSPSPWEATDGLFERGLISDPKSKAKSVMLTQDGARLAEELFLEMFGTDDAATE